MAIWRPLPINAALRLDAESWERSARLADSPFLHREWLLAWQTIAGAAAARAFVFARRDDDGAVPALVPVMRSRCRVGAARATTLTWAGDDTGCPDHLEIPAESDVAVDALAEELARAEWDVLTLRNLRENAPRAARLASRLSELGFHVTTAVCEPCPMITLPPSWDEYLAAQSSSRRQTIRRKERKLAREHQLVVRDYDAHTLDDGWKVLGTLHSERWSGATAFTPAVAEMHREFARLLAARGALWLTALELDGIAVAAWYGFTEGDTVFFFQSGRSLEHQQDSVGQVLMGMMIRRAIERGYRRFDFLRGDEPYKASWTDEQRTTWTLVVTRPGASGRWVRAHQRLDTMIRLSRSRIGRMLRPRRSR
jgi:CelD/BcsL family acetyltransferase involved in cellulose biosynthesis